MIYFDNNATTPILEEVAEEIKNNLILYGNPSSIHQIGREIKEKIEYARFQVSKLINCKPDNIIFTSGGTEANNTILNSFALRYKKEGKILVSKIEHPSILNYSKNLLENNFDIEFLNVDSNGKIIIEELENKLAKTDKKVLLTVMLANNETGVLQDIKSIVKIAKKYGALIHADMVQALGKIKIDLEKIDLDYATFSSHKINGPKGTGAIYFKKELLPLIQGGHQEKSLRGGTENTIGIIGFGKAAEIREKNIEKYISHVSELRNLLLQGLEENIKDIIINTPIQDSIPNTLNVSFKGVEGEAILLSLDLEGIAVSTGSACSSGELEPSHVLIAMGIPHEIAHGSIRFSFGIQNKKEEVYYTIEKLKKVIAKLREMSPIY